MKKIMIVAVILISFCQCSKDVTHSALISGLPVTDENTAFVRSAGYGKNRFEILANAEERAFKAVMFTGIPGGTPSRPLIANEQKSREQYRSFYQEFFNGRVYLDYMISNTPSSEIEKVKGNKRMMCDIKINLAGLRAHLESNQVIRKFGY